MNAVRDWQHLPLAGAGRSLVEASAGTGKTWTIGVLYLRLLLEEKRTPREILVSTFTDAAAAELRERLRARLVWALEQAEGSTVPDDAVGTDIVWLHARWGDADQRRSDIARLRAAVASFDQAPVATLHALCSRILADHPFAAGSLFRALEPADVGQLSRELSDDLWRRLRQGDPETDPLAKATETVEVTRAKLGEWLRALLQPDTQVPTFDERALLEKFAFLGELRTWIAATREVLACEANFNKSCALRTRWGGLVDALEAPREHLGTLLGDKKGRGVLDRAGAMTGISAAGKKDPRIIALLEQTGQIMRVLDALDAQTRDVLASLALAAFLRLLQQEAAALLAQRLLATDRSTFDALLSSVREAVTPGPDGARPLADALHAAWPVAMVDEFQDTDPVQYAILDAIYRDARGAARGRLVMIGDPKQAIYRFRGGDVLTYQRAGQGVAAGDTLVLGTNHRSSRAYVDACNAFYALTGSSLGPDDGSGIRYESVAASARQDGTPLRDRTGQPIERPLIIHLLGHGSQEEASREEASQEKNRTTLGLRACADQIARLLEHAEWRIGEKPLQPSDIAVLLPSNANVQTLVRMLKLRGVPCVSSSRDRTVFDSAVARELRIVLHAVLHADEPASLRAALGTRLWGMSLGQLSALAEDPVQWSALAHRFRQLHVLWSGRGPLAVINELLNHAASRVLTTVEGERILTDLRHLGELLQAAAEPGRGAESLLAWLADQTDAASRDGSGDADAAAIRLESDAHRVRVMTLHASKGLEFPVVFLPLMWNNRRVARGVRTVVDPHAGVRTLVLGGTDSPADLIAQRQELEERYRLLYVALTRAIHACHLFAVGGDGEPAQEGESGMKFTDAPLKLFARRLQAPGSGESAASEYAAIAWRSGWQLYPGVMYRPAVGVAAPVQARPMPKAALRPLPRRHSFSSLHDQHHIASGSSESAAADEEPGLGPEPLVERDAQASASRTPHAQLEALGSVAGTDFGNAVHAIFERREFGRLLCDQEALVLDCLLAEGVRPLGASVDALVTPLIERLQQVLDTPLGALDGPRLGALEPGDTVAEMQFDRVLEGVSMAELRRVCREHGEPDLVPSIDSTLRGVLNGKIDLVFRHAGRYHVLDYKSNRLAPPGEPCLEHYGPGTVHDAMNANGYRFQALLYAVAIDRYLRERLGRDYERSRHLGECWYLFVRATGLVLPSGEPCGVWRHRFDDGLLDAVQAVLSVRREAGQ